MTQPFTYGHASAAYWRDAASRCLAQAGRGPDGANLGFVYATDHLTRHLSELIDFLKRNTGIAHWVGSVGTGISATGVEYHHQPAVAIMLCSFLPEQFRVFSGVSCPGDLENLSTQFGESQANFALVHGDPSNQELPRLVSDLADHMESGFIAGGLTSSRFEKLQVADAPVRGGLSGVMFSEDVIVATRLTQGCLPIGPRHVITSSRHNIVIELDGRAALDVLRQDVGETLWDNLQTLGGTLFAGLPAKGGCQDDYMIRNLVGVDPVHKILAISDVAEQGTRLMFCRRDVDAAREDMARMLDSIKSGLFRRPRGAIYHSCVGRGSKLFSLPSEELKMVSESLGEIPLVGFFCSGEISHNRLYGYTGVLTLFL
jgi:small ligand-binding sensory domain FIST